MSTVLPMFSSNEAQRNNIEMFKNFNKEKESKSVGLEKKDGMNRARWRVGDREIASRVG